MLVIAVKDDRIKPPTTLAVEGGNVKFTCESQSYVLWKFNGENLPPNTKQGVEDEGNLNWLTINRVSRNNEGTYSCVGQVEDFLFFEAKASLDIKSE